MKTMSGGLLEKSIIKETVCKLLNNACLKFVMLS